MNLKTGPARTTPGSQGIDPLNSGLRLGRRANGDGTMATVMSTPTEPARHALVVRGGWPGRQPQAATDEFLPFLQAHAFSVRIEGSPEVYADAEYLAGVDLIVQCVSRWASKVPG